MAISYNYSLDIFEYECSDKKDILLIKEHFEFMEGFTDDKYFYYRVNIKNIRKIKLLIIQKSVDYKNFERILKRSKNITYEDMLSKQLTRELARSIDKEILKTISKMK